MDITLQVRERGVVTLPAELRAKYGIEPGDTFRLVDMDGVFVLTALVPMVSELAREMAEELGITRSAIEKQIAKLRQEGRIRRIGADRGGHWEVVE